MASLEFLIPSYRRPESVLEAISSVAIQVAVEGYHQSVRISVIDDASDNVDVDAIRDAFPEHRAYLSIARNPQNKGMSRNIRDMVKGSAAEFCTVLTDDDRLQPGALPEIMDLLESGLQQMGCEDVGSFFVPRYSYLDDGSLHCVVCKPFPEDVCIASGPLNSMKHCYDGFVLTGLFFRPNLINFSLWDLHIENAYFPIIYFGDLVRCRRSLFLNRNWFHHTVLNECHWECWGTTERARKIRTYADALEATTVTAQSALEVHDRSITLREAILIRVEESHLYRAQMHAAQAVVRSDDQAVRMRTRKRIAYRWAVATFWFKRIRNRLRFLVKQLLRAGGLISKSPDR